MAHTHEHDDQPAPPRLRRLVIVMLVPLVVATLIGLVLLWPGDTRVDFDGIGVAKQLVDATVTDRDEVPCEGGADPGVRCLLLDIRIDEGPDRGESLLLEQSESTARDSRFGTGEAIVLGYEPNAPPGSEYFYADHQRRRPMLALAVVFAVVVVLLGRWRGLAALGGLVVSLGVLVLFVLPALLEGSNPLAVAVVGASMIMFVALYLAHGLSVRTSMAVLGTLASLALTGVLAMTFIAASKFSGVVSDEAAFLNAVAGQVDLEGLLLAGVIIGSLGVLDDVTVTQASAIWELHAANPLMSARDLYRAGIRIGRDHIASTVNTLVLAYAGASLPLLVLFTLADRGLGDVLTGEVVAQEVVRTLVGSIGLVASVPLTTALSAFAVRRAGVVAGGHAAVPDQDEG